MYFEIKRRFGSHWGSQTEWELCSSCVVTQEVLRQTAEEEWLKPWIAGGTVFSNKYEAYHTRGFDLLQDTPQEVVDRLVLFLVHTERSDDA